MKQIRKSTQEAQEVKQKCIQKTFHNKIPDRMGQDGLSGGKCENVSENNRVLSIMCNQSSLTILCHFNGAGTLLESPGPSLPLCRQPKDDGR